MNPKQLRWLPLMTSGLETEGAYSGRSR